MKNDKTDGKLYSGELGLKNLLNYIFRYDKIAFDSKRPLYDDLHSFTGCNPFLFPKDEMDNPESIFLNMFVIHKYFSKNDIDIVRHIVVSFSPDSLIYPYELNGLGEAVLNFFSANGFMAAYAIHRDHYCSHIHFAVLTTSYQDGRKLYIQNDFEKINNIVMDWVKLNEEKFDNNPDLVEKYANDLFGDDLPHYYPIAFNTKMQIDINRKYKEERKIKKNPYGII